MIEHWRTTLAAATSRAEAMLPASVSGMAVPPMRHRGTVGDSVLDDARALLARIKAGLGKLAAKGFKTITDADTAALRKAASVLGAGAREAAKLATRAKDAAVKELKQLASDAYSVAIGPAMLIVGLLILSSGGESKKDDSSTNWLLAGLAWAASRGML